MALEDPEEKVVLHVLKGGNCTLGELASLATFLSNNMSNSCKYSQPIHIKANSHVSQIYHHGFHTKHFQNTMVNSTMPFC